MIYRIFGILDALFYPQKGLKKGGIQYTGSQNFEVLEWRLSRPKRSGETPEDHEKTDVVIKDFEFMFLANILIRTLFVAI